MKFKGTYKHIGKNRWFYTILVALPEESKIVLNENLAPLLPFCNWLTTLANDHSRDLPHITLRYLGHADELKVSDIKNDYKNFEESLYNLNNLEIELGDIDLYTREVNGKITTARLNWQIKNKQPLIKIHETLLKIPNYYFFSDLEGENYNPHISLGSVNLEVPKNYEQVKSHLENIEFSIHKYTLKDFWINMPSENEVTTVPINRQ